MTANLFWRKEIYGNYFMIEKFHENNFEFRNNKSELRHHIPERNKKSCKSRK